MAISDILNKRIRARRDEDDDDLVTDSSSSEGEERRGDEDIGLSGDDASEDHDSVGEDVENEDDDDEDEEVEDEEGDSMSDSEPGENEALQSEMRQISFGALAKARDSLGKRKRGQTDSTTSRKEENTTPSTLDGIRERLRKAREEKEQSKGSKAGSHTKPPTRTSKHAPTVQSSRYQVSRKRIVVEPPNAAKARDPRFDPTVAATRHNEAALSKAYSFLDDYRSSEIKQLREQLSRTKDPALKEKLKRAITSATDRKRAIDNKKREQDVLSEHKKRERQLLREGKKSQPYFLKKSELKREVLKKKYENMKSKERAKALERRRKKVASKEKKDLPWARRGMEEAASAS